MREELDAGPWRLRPFAVPGSAGEAHDGAALIAAYADPQMARFVSWRVHDTADAVEYLARRDAEWQAGTRCSWAVTDTTGAIAGEVGVKEIDHATATARMAVWTHPAFRGRGVAAAAVRAAADFGFDRLGLTWIGYTHAEANAASALVAERAGFVRVGREFPDAPSHHSRADRILWVREKS